MSKKAFIITLILSVVVTYGVAIVDDIRRGSLLGGEGGIPLRFSHAGSFSSGSTDYLMLSLDIIFWFIIIFTIWKLLKGFSKKHISS